MGARHLFILCALLLLQACGVESAPSESDESSKLSSQEACEALSRLVSVPCDTGGEQELSITGSDDYLIYGALQFNTIPIQGTCNDGEFPDNKVRARIFDSDLKLIAHSPFTRCSANGTFNAVLPISGVSREADHYVEVEIFGIDGEGKSHTNLPKSKRRYFYPAQ